MQFFPNGQPPRIERRDVMRLLHSMDYILIGAKHDADSIVGKFGDDWVTVIWKHEIEVIYKTGGQFAIVVGRLPLEDLPFQHVQDWYLEEDKKTRKSTYERFWWKVKRASGE